MKVAIYARVSTEEQTTENQLPLLEKFAENRGWQVAAVYQENESAWKAGHQRELSNALNAASRHQFDILLVWALDRLTRQGIASIFSLVNTFKNYGCQVISLQELWTEQAGGPMAELLYSVTAWVAKFESDRKSARVKAAVERRKRLGLHVGRKAGAKDNPDKPRKRTGYLLRYADRRPNKGPAKNGAVATLGKGITNNG